MKKIVMLMLVIQFISNSTQAKSKKSVLEYYHSIPAKHLRARYKVVYKNKKWVTDSMVDYEMPVIVDKKNGYLKIADQGTGGGTLVHEFAVFVDSKGNRFVARNVVEYDGVGVIAELKIFKVTGNDWIDVTKKIFPVISDKEFFDKKFDTTIYKNVTKKKRAKFETYSSLPRYGLVIKVNLSTSKINSVIEYSKSSDKEKSDWKELKKEIKYNIIKIKFNKKKAKFEIIGKE